MLTRPDLLGRVEKDVQVGSLLDKYMIGSELSYIWFYSVISRLLLTSHGSSEHRSVAPASAP